MSCACGCCAGVESRTPEETANPPGRDALHYRVGRYGTFLDSMLAGLSDPALATRDALRTRDSEDPAIALLDASATLLDVLTFYQERIANEGYLRSATERRSVLELAKLVGYKLRPGLSASAFLAFTIETGHRLTIPKGSKAQSVPGPDELPQMFETSEDLKARWEWNQLRPRRTEPQITLPKDPTSALGGARRVYLKGTNTGLRVNDPLLVQMGKTAMPVLYRVVSVAPDTAAERTLVRMRPWHMGDPLAVLRRLVKHYVEASPLLIPVSATRDAVIGILKDLQLSIEDREPNDVFRELNGSVRPKVQEALRVNANARHLQPWLAQLVRELDDVAAVEAAIEKDSEVAVESADFNLSAAVNASTKPLGINPRNSASLRRSLSDGVTSHSDAALGVIGTLEPGARAAMANMLKSAHVASDSALRVFALRVRAPLFGHNAPRELVSLPRDLPPVFEEWSGEDMRGPEGVMSTVHLDAKYESIVPGSWVVVDTSAVATDLGVNDPRPTRRPLLIARAGAVNALQSRSAYSLTGPTTVVPLLDTTDRAEPVDWIYFPERGPEGHAVDAENDRAFTLVRRTVVLTGSELLELAEAPMPTSVCSGTTTPLELGALYTDLEPGRWIIVSGERTDIPGTSGVEGSELAMIASVEHDGRRAVGRILPGETLHTTITLATALSYCYRRDTAVIYANVVHATHGETRKETLGGGNAAEAFQRFTLKAAPVTFLAAPTAEGAATTLELRVNDVRWHERDSLADAKPSERVFVTSTDDDAKTSITGGDGRNHGARFPTGIENIKAVYRNGIGRAGNVKDKQISLLGSRPLGVKEVINPLRASGGADADSRDQARRNIPVALQALDRLISIRDHADFARAFAGIGKAIATSLSDGERLLVHVTIAGANDIPILTSSDLFQNLSAAFRELGDPVQPVYLAVRELVLLVISAGVRLHRDYIWESVEPKIRARLLERFGFEARELGRSVSSSEVIAAIHSVNGVDYVDLNAFGGIPERVSIAGPPRVRQLITPDEIAQRVAAIEAAGLSSVATEECPWPSPFCPVRASLARIDGEMVIPAQLAILSPEVPSTLILSLIENGTP